MDLDHLGDAARGGGWCRSWGPDLTPAYFFGRDPRNTFLVPVFFFPLSTLHPSELNNHSPAAKKKKKKTVAQMEWLSLLTVSNVAAAIAVIVFTRITWQVSD
jgi:hypothetical protein